MAAHIAPTHSTRDRTIAWSAVFDAVTYWTGMAAIYLMAFAQNMIADHESVASLFTYMGVTAVIFALVRFVPPFRGDRAGS
jgi:hypothetical protein